MKRAPIAALAVIAAGIAAAAPGFVPVEVTIRPIADSVPCVSLSM